MVVQELVALLGVKTDKQSVDKAQNGMKGLINVAKAAAAAFAAIGAVRWVKGVVEQVAKAGDRFDKMALRTGIASETLQQFSHAAELSGASLNDVEASIKRLQTAQSDAAFGLETYTREFKRLGVEAQNTDGSFKDTTQLLLEVADGMKNLESDTERTAVAVKLLGRSGTNLIPLLKQGGGAVREMMLEVQELGGMMSDDLRIASAKYIDNQQRMKVATEGVKYAIGNELLPVINELTDSSIAWWKENGKLIRQNVAGFFRKLARPIGRVVKFLIKVEKWSFKFRKNLDPLSKKILGVTAALIGFIALLKMGVWGKWAIKLALILLAIEDLQVFLEGGNSALGKFFDWVKKTTGIDFAPWIRKFADALNILAADPEPFDWDMWGQEVFFVIEEYLNAAKHTWINVWESIWKWYSDLFVDNPLANYLGSAIDAFVSFWSFLYNGFDALIDFFKTVWDGPQEAWENFYNSIINGAKNLFDKITSLGGALKKLFGFGGTSDKSEGGQSAASPVLRGARDVMGGGQSAVVSGAGIQPLSPVGRSGRGGAGQYTNAPVINMNVKATPGMSEQRLARESTRQMSRELEKQNKRTLEAFTSKKAG